MNRLGRLTVCQNHADNVAPPTRVGTGNAGGLFDAPVQVRAAVGYKTVEVRGKADFPSVRHGCQAENGAGLAAKGHEGHAVLGTEHCQNRLDKVLDQVETTDAHFATVVKFDPGNTLHRARRVDADDIVRARRREGRIVRHVGLNLYVVFAVFACKGAPPYVGPHTDKGGYVGLCCCCCCCCCCRSCCSSCSCCCSSCSCCCCSCCSSCFRCCCRNHLPNQKVGRERQGTKAPSCRRAGPVPPGKPVLDGRSLIGVPVLCRHGVHHGDLCNGAFEVLGYTHSGLLLLLLLLLLLDCCFIGWSVDRLHPFKCPSSHQFFLRRVPDTA